MEIITGPAKDLVGKIFDYAFATVGREVGYLIHYKRNLENLQTEVARLSVAKETVNEKITAAEAKGHKIYSRVRVWLENVTTITNNAEKLLKDKQHATIDDASNLLKDDDQPKTKCVLGICPNPVNLRRRSKNSLTLVEGVTELIKEEKELSDISFEPPKDLQTEVEKLSVAKETLAEEVAAAEVKGEKIHANVLEWLKGVTKIVEKAEEFLKDKHRSTEEASEFMKDDIQAIEKPESSLSHASKESTELLLEVTKLYERREFSKISYILPPEDKCMASDEDYEEFDSRTLLVDKILTELGTSSSSDMILVYGVGGVGKTTLVQEVLRKTRKQFRYVVLVRDVKIPNMETIQYQIADKLGLKNIMETQSLPGRADKINERIKNTKVLFIFDDVWGEIDLKAVGLPHNSTCRILLTSRSQQIFSHEIKQKEFQLGVLNDKEAWALFEKKAGDVVADPIIQPVAAQVAKKCGGLPVLVITVARALENKNLPIWKNALKKLERFDEKGDLTHKAYSGIEWSYSQLSDKEKLQPLFLLCGSIAKGNYISLTNLLKYGIGLGFFEDCTVEEARNALYEQVDKLKSSCLLLDSDDGTCVRMHDLVRDVANGIARRDQHALIDDGDHKLGKWPDEDFFSECSKICLPCCNIATLPQVPWDCPKLEMFHLHRKDDDDSSPELPSNFFEEMKKLKVLGLSNVPPRLLPPSFLFPKNLQTLCLDGCVLKDIALVGVGELSNLEVLSMANSEVKQLPKEFGQLTRLRLVDLSDCCEELEVPAGVISNWTRLEDLRMRNICQSNASLVELMNLPELTALEVFIPDIEILPPKFFHEKLEKFQIFFGEWGMLETTLNTVKLQFNTSTRYEFVHDQGFKILLKRCEVLFFSGGDTDVDFSFVMKTKVVMSHLTTLNVNCCVQSKYLLSSSMVKSLVKLKHLEISYCYDMEEIVSTRDSHGEGATIIFEKLESLTLIELRNLVRFCTAGSYIEFPVLEKLDMNDCCVRECASTENSSLCKEIEDTELDEENSDVLNETCTQTFLFDEKVRCPRLQTLQISINFQGYEIIFQTLWHSELLAPGSFCRLREVKLSYCDGSLRSIFPPSMMGRLSALETLDINGCESVEVIFEERGETSSVNGTHGTITTQSRDGENLKSLQIHNCPSLKYIFPASMVTRGLHQLQKLEVMGCEMETVVAKEKGVPESTKHPKFLFPKVTSVKFEYMPRLRSFYPGIHTSEWPLLRYLNVSETKLVEIFAAELSVFQEHPTKQPFFLFDKGSIFPVLEELVVNTPEILYASSSFLVESMFSKLKSVRFTRCLLFPDHTAVLFLQKLPSLEMVIVDASGSEYEPSVEYVDEGYMVWEEDTVESLALVRVVQYTCGREYPVGWLSYSQISYDI